MFVNVSTIAKPLQATSLAVVILMLTAAMADARRQGRHHRHHHGYTRHAIIRLVPPPQDYARGRFERGRLSHFGMAAGPFDPRRESFGNRRRSAESNIVALVPRDWRLEPPDATWNGNRFISPEGDAWLAFYAREADEQTRDQHLKTVGFVEGEDITYLQRERDWLAVSGFSGEKHDRIFYRKVVLSCGGRLWRHFALEHPAAAKRAFEPLVVRLSQALDRAADAGCEAGTVGQR